MKPKPKKPDTRPDSKKAPLKRRVKLVDGSVITLHPSDGKLKGWPR